MPAKLNDIQLDALADCIGLLIELARKHRQGRGTLGEVHKGNSVPGVVASNQVVQRADPETSRRAKK